MAVGLRDDAAGRKTPSRGGRTRISAAFVRRHHDGVWGLVGIAGAVVLWHLAAAWYDSVVFPAPAETFSALWQLLTDGALRETLTLTLRRVTLGFALGSLAGVSLGLVMGESRTIRELFEPYVNFFRFVTPIAWIAPATVWFGVGETTKLFMMVYATMFIVIINTMVGVVSIPRNRKRMAAQFGATRLQRFRRITVPSSVPFILTGMRIGLGNSFMTVVGAEMLAGTNGLGNLIYRSRLFLNSDVMFAGILILGVLGFLADRGFAFLRGRSFKRFDPVASR